MLPEGTRLVYQRGGSIIWGVWNKRKGTNYLLVPTILQKFAPFFMSGFQITSDLFVEGMRKRGPLTPPLPR